MLSLRKRRIPRNSLIVRVMAVLIMAGAIVGIPIGLPVTPATEASCFTNDALCNIISQYGVCFNGGTGFGSYDISFTLAPSVTFTAGTLADCGPGEIELCSVSPTASNAFAVNDHIFRIYPSSGSAFTVYFKFKVYNYALDSRGKPIKNSALCDAFSVYVDPSSFSSPGCAAAVHISC